jgi:hypothetical protein
MYEYELDLYQREFIAEFWRLIYVLHATGAIVQDDTEPLWTLHREQLKAAYELGSQQRGLVGSELVQ